MIIKCNWILDLAKLVNRMEVIGLTLFPFIFVRDKKDRKNVNHEKIHYRQQLELLVLPFYLLYVIFHVIYSYDFNPFEREAYKNEKDFTYLNKRNAYGWRKYLRKGR